jgi:hypothetical protein
LIDSSRIDRRPSEGLLEAVYRRGVSVEIEERAPVGLGAPAILDLLKWWHGIWGNEKLARQRSRED